MHPPGPLQGSSLARAFGRVLAVVDMHWIGLYRYMAPEVLNSKQMPASDVWSAGVMAYQLLSGYLPFNDHRNPDSPALSVIW